MLQTLLALVQEALAFLPNYRVEEQVGEVLEEQVEE